MKAPRTWPYWAVILMLIAWVFSLMLDLRISRSNEREMSRRLYEVGKYGMQRATNNESNSK